MKVHVILYVADQAASTRFYRAMLDAEPSLDVPGMTEFAITPSCVLGLMPEAGIRKLLGAAIPDPAAARGVPRAELYLLDERAPQLHERALAAGARALGGFEVRDWGDRVAYASDPDGHVIAFATAAEPAPASAGLPARDSAVTLREIGEDDVRAICRLDVAPFQRRFVAANSVSLAQAHFSPHAWFRAIHAGDAPVGFVMLHDDPSKSEYHLWRFMIDRRFQGLGFGRRAMELVIAHVRGRPGATELLTSAVPGEGSPRPFYEGLGFVATGAVDDGEDVLRLAL